MAADSSFDVVSDFDQQELVNALDQARREIATRYDFKGSPVQLTLDKGKSLITLEAENDYKLKAAYDVLQTKFFKRGVPLKNMKPGKEIPASHGRVRQEITLTQGIPTDTAREIVKAVKAKGFKKVQVAIQGRQSAPREITISISRMVPVASTAAFTRTSGAPIRAPTTRSGGV